MLALLIEALFALMFLHAGATYLRTRDPVQRDAMLVFAVIASLLVLTLFTRFWGQTPRPVAAVAVVALLGKPYLIVRLAAQLRPVPGWVRWGTLAVWLGTAIPIALAGTQPAPALVLAAVGAFAVGEGAGAWHLAAAARRRTGSSGVRLWCAAAATVLFALAMVTAGVAAGLASSVIALVSTAGYLLAFLPPRWLREFWSGRAAYTLVRELLAGPGAEPDRGPGPGRPTPRSQPAEREAWPRYARTVRRASSSDAAIVLVPTPDGDLTEVARDGTTGSAARRDPEQVTALLAATGPVDVVAGRPAAAGTTAIAVARDLAQGTDARFVTAVPLHLQGGVTGAVILLDRYRSLFTGDDAALLGGLGAQAAILADHEALTAQLADAAVHAAAANKAKSDFVASMSHELRTPLNAIIGFSELMGHEPKQGSNRSVPAEWIDHIYHSGRHLLGLINDVLDLSKVEAGRMELAREPVDVAEAVAEAVTALAPLLDGKRLEVAVDVPTTTVLADRIRLRQVLDNLLSNAIKFTPERGRVTVAGRVDGPEVRISVTDTGPGIAPADQERVFEEFHQVGDPSMHKAGTGLGLSLVRRLVEAHGGRITLESASGHGSTFTITLPAWPADETGRSFRGGILMIEDDPAATGLVGTLLRRAGYRVTAVATGEEGLAAAGACIPDLILLDVLLPGMDGWEVLRRVRADERLRHVPVAVVTVLDDRPASMAMELGATDYFVKPVSGDTLLTWLARQGYLPPLAGAGARTAG